MRNFLMLSLVCLLSGCATLERGDNQELQVQTRNTPNTAKTTCTLKNEDGYWTIIPNRAEEAQKQVSSHRKIVLDRDGGTLYVSCDNDEQMGETQVKSNFDKKYFQQDLFSLCLFCIVDAASGAFFSYPYIVYVEMIDRRRR